VEAKPQPPPTKLPAGVRRAALAFSILPTPQADAVSHLLTMRERVSLRQGLTQVRDAGDAERVAALHALVRAIRNGVDWPYLETHNAHDCPFHCIEGHPLERVAGVFNQLAERQAITVAVALCHLTADKRDEIWTQLRGRTRALVLPQVVEVPLVGPVRTRILAREVDGRLARAAKIERTRPQLER
jgi:hypothetical protein